MIADVPLGAFLSGGIDSSTVVALMQAQSAKPVRTFTIGFREDAYNEAESAKRVAEHLGTDHTELYVTSDEAREVIPLLPDLYDEPFADSSQIPTFLVSKLARRQVTVSLSGDGGDELFGGYSRYTWAPSIWSWLRYVWPLRATLRRAIRLGPPAFWETTYRALEPLVPSRLRIHNAADKAWKLARLLDADSSDGFFLGVVSQWNLRDGLVILGEEPDTILRDRSVGEIESPGWPRG